MTRTRCGPYSFLRSPVVDGGLIKEDDLAAILHELRELDCKLSPLQLECSILEGALTPSLLGTSELDLVGFVEQSQYILRDSDVKLLLDSHGPLLD